MYKNVKRTCRVLFWLINPIVLWRSRCRRRRRCLSSLLSKITPMFLAECEGCIKPGSHLRHNDITGRLRKRKKYLVLMFYVSSVNNTS